MANLTAEQERLLEEVRAAHETRVTTRAEVEARVRRELDEVIRVAGLTESRAVRKAIEAGVPRSRIGREGLGTRDYATVARVLALTDPEHAMEEAVKANYVAPRARRATQEERDALAFAVDPAQVLILVSWADYRPETAGLRAFGEQVTLRGFVAQGTRRRVPWEVLRDDTSDDPNYGPLHLAVAEPAVIAVLERAAA